MQRGILIAFLLRPCSHDSCTGTCFFIDYSEMKSKTLCTAKRYLHFVEVYRMYEIISNYVNNKTVKTSLR